MKLTAWCDAVAYGPYFQPIHLQVDNSDETCASTVQKVPETSRPVDTEMKNVNANENSTTQESVDEALTDEERATTSIATTDRTISTTVIPPFASKCFNYGEQIVLNVGGPVWAMDWLPSKPAENAVEGAASYDKTTPKKIRAVSPARKACKESQDSVTSDDVDEETTEALIGSVETVPYSQLEWRILALSTHPPCQVADKKVVKATPPDHYYDVAESARNLIQIWAVPVQQPVVSSAEQFKIEEKGTNDPVQPRIVYAIDHDSGVAWDMQWCPLAAKFPSENQRNNILGVLAVCFGDGSMRVFEVPAILDEMLQPTLAKEADCVVEKNIPIVVAKLPRIMQLSVQWSPHHWNLLLTGGSDGSVSLWNIETCTGKIDSFETEVSEPEILEPQRRFQDADTVGKQEAFDWGCGWVAIRAVAWSPFDDHIFATTGNDSVFKVWDVREPRVCLRSHRIRSTWGLALQWMDQTSIQISGDQGSVYMYDILSGSYQKLHYHPQIDSPVWDLQFARRGAIPLLVSACTSGSIRAAPAKKLFRSPQNCVEICRLSGEKDASIEKPFKALTISFQKHSVVGSADPVKQTSREFCERDAALHRLRLSSSTTGDYPCFLAAGGHAGLVILLEVQKTLDTLISTFFYAPKRLGRPKKICTTEKNTVSSKMGGGKTKGTRSTGKKTRTLGGSFAKAKSMRTAVSKYTKKLPLKAKAKGKRLRRQVLANSFLQDDGAVEAVGCVEEEEESEFEGDEDEDESEMSMVLEDSSDDDRIRDSDDDVEDEMETMVEDVNPEEARLMKEYQLDLSEEDAYLLALQLSETTDAAGVETSDGKTPKAETNIGKPDSTPVSRETERSETHVTSARTTAQANGLAGKAAGKGKKRARPVHSTSVATDSAATKLDVVIKAKKKIKVQVGDSDTPECKASSVVAPGSSAESLTRAVSNKTKRKSKQPSEAPTRKVFTAKTDKRNPLLLHQTMALQSYAYQKGMSEEDALKEAIRLSAMDGKPRSVCDNHLPSDPAKGALPTPTQPKQTPATPRTKVTKQMKAKVAKETVTVGEPDAVFFAAKDGPQQRLPQTPRRLEFSPLNESEGVGPIEIPTANIDSEILGPELAGSCQLDAAHTALAVTKLPCSSSFSSEAATANSMAPLSSAQTSSSNEPEGVETKEAALTSFSNSKQPSMFSRTSDKSSKARGSTRKGKSSTSRGGRRKPSSSAAPTSDEDAMLLAIQLSKVEY